MCVQASHPPPIAPEQTHKKTPPFSKQGTIRTLFFEERGNGRGMLLWKGNAYFPPFFRVMTSCWFSFLFAHGRLRETAAALCCICFSSLLFPNNTFPLFPPPIVKQKEETKINCHNNYGLASFLGIFIDFRLLLLLLLQDHQSPTSRETSVRRRRRKELEGRAYIARKIRAMIQTSKSRSAAGEKSAESHSWRNFMLYETSCFPRLSYYPV